MGEHRGEHNFGVNVTSRSPVARTMIYDTLKKVDLGLSLPSYCSVAARLLCFFCNLQYTVQHPLLVVQTNQLLI